MFSFSAVIFGRSLFIARKSTLRDVFAFANECGLQGATLQIWDEEANEIFECCLAYRR